MARVNSTPETVEPEFPVSVANDYAINYGQNLANHTAAMRGLGKFVRVGMHTSTGDFPIFRTRQEAYRFIGWILAFVEKQELPDEDGSHSFEQVTEAIRESLNG